MDTLQFRASRADEVGRLYDIWFAAVSATHNFLSPSDLDAIARAFREDYIPLASFTVAVCANDRALGFMAMTGMHIDALFIDPACHGQGIGRAFVERSGASSVDVNEQNAGATTFYKRLGFAVASRSLLDDAGRPYPILHLRRDAA